MTDEPTINVTVRDAARATVAAIDRAAAAAGMRREAFIREDWDRRFVTGSPTNAISTRFRAAVDELIALGSTLDYHRPPSFAAIARELRHENTAQLESAYHGQQPLSFRDGDRYCELTGLNRRYLDDNASAPYAQEARFSGTTRLLIGTYAQGLHYDKLWFVLQDDPRGEAAVFGHHREHSPWRIELLVQGVPIHDDVGAGGESELRDFCFYLSLLGNISTSHNLLTNRRPEPSFTSRGLILEPESYRALLHGRQHPGAILCRRGVATSNWYEDLADVDYMRRERVASHARSRYTENWARAFTLYQSLLEMEKLTNGTDVLLYIYDTYLRQNRPHDFDVARLLRERHPEFSSESADKVIDLAKAYARRDIHDASRTDDEARAAWVLVANLYDGTQAITPAWLHHRTFVAGYDGYLEARYAQPRNPQEPPTQGSGEATS